MARAGFEGSKSGRGVAAEPEVSAADLDGRANGRDVVVIGGSAGALDALRALVAALPAELPAAVFVVLHLAPAGSSFLANILAAAGPLPVRAAVDGAPIERGTLTVAVPDCHLMLAAGSVVVQRGPRENRVRPAIDPLLRSAAAIFGPRVVAVILSGALDDGAAGLRAVLEQGGVALVQDPAEALQPSMPSAAIAAADGLPGMTVLPSLRLGPRIVAAVREAHGRTRGVPELLAAEDRFARGGSTMEEIARLGRPSSLTCPECGGSLWELPGGPLPRYRCHTGHAFSAESLEAAELEKIEEAMWAAVRALEEHAALADRLEHGAREHGHPQVARRHAARARTSRSHADTIRKVVLRFEAAPVDPAAVEEGGSAATTEEEHDA